MVPAEALAPNTIVPVSHLELSVVPLIVGVVQPTETVCVSVHPEDVSVKVIVVDPVATPVTTPLEFIVALETSEELHVPAPDRNSGVLGKGVDTGGAPDIEGEQLTVASFWVLGPAVPHP